MNMTLSSHGVPFHRNISRRENKAQIPLIIHPVAEPAYFHRGGQGGASNQSGVAQKSSLFQYKNVVDYKVLDYFSA